MTTLERISPDGIAAPGDTIIDDLSEPKVWELLDPCPGCGARPHAAPEGAWHSGHREVMLGSRTAGDPIWDHAHCWKCGHRPGTNLSLSIDEMSRRFEAFQKFTMAQVDQYRTAPGLSAPVDNDEIAALKAAMQIQNDKLEALLNPQTPVMSTADIEAGARQKLLAELRESGVLKDSDS